MSDVLDAATDNANDEYDWSLPFVTAAGEEVIDNNGNYYLYTEGFKDPEDPSRILY